MIREKFSKLSEKDKRLLLLIEVMLLAVFVILIFLLRSSFESRTAQHYKKPASMPVVTAERGHLTFDSVRVTVPKEGAAYVIGYDPADPDEEFPSVPSSASAFYSDENGDIDYEVLLYRDRIIPKATDHEVYTLESWYEEWQSSDKNSVQEAYSTPATKGYLIRSLDEASAKDDAGDNAENDAKKEDAPDAPAEDAASDGSEASSEEEGIKAEAAGTDDGQAAADEAAPAADDKEKASDPDAPGDGTPGEKSSEGGDGTKINCSYTYYFAVETKDNIEQFVLELDYYDPAIAGKAEELFRSIADSIEIRKPA